MLNLSKNWIGEPAGIPKFKTKFGIGISDFDTFWARNRDKLGNVIMTEQPFGFELGGFKFSGKIDRVDLLMVMVRSRLSIIRLAGSRLKKIGRASCCFISWLLSMTLL